MAKGIRSIVSKRVSVDQCVCVCGGITVVQEQPAKALQAVQDGGNGEGVSDDVVGESGTEDDQALVAMSLSQVE